jgi:hypothetical protein
MTRPRICFTFGISVLLLLGCGQTPPSNLTNLASLPGATDGVASTNAGDFEKNKLGLALVGLPLASVGTTNWTGKSRAMCETGNALTSMYARAGQADQATCFLGQLEQQSILPTGFYDGNDHYYTLTTGGIPWMFLKLNATKGGQQNAQIQTYSLWACVSFGNVVPTQQTVYASYNLTNTAAAQISVLTSISANLGVLAATYSGSANVTGALNGSGTWISKTLSGQNYFSGTASSPNFSVTDAGAANITQTANGWTIAANTSGSESVYGVSLTGCNATPVTVQHSSSVNVLADGLNMTNPATVALGDGAAMGSYSYSFKDINNNPVTGGNCTVSPVTSQVSSWLGDSQTVTASNADTASVQSATLSASNPAVPTSVISFSGSQSWNCSAPGSNPSTSIEVDLSELEIVESTCNGKYQLAADSWALCSAGSL